MTSFPIRMGYSMDPEFWHQRWREDRIGFHQDRPMPLLREYWPEVAPAADSR